MVADKESSIDFARKETLGVQYIGEVRSVQDAVVRGADMIGLEGRVRANETADSAGLKTARATDSLLKALAGADRVAAAQAASDLIGKAADGSNLTLDPDLDSFYTKHALTAKVPAAVAGVASLATSVAGPQAMTFQVTIGIQGSALQPALDGSGLRHRKRRRR
jgi:methyl-accepting chemotaxis protein